MNAGRSLAASFLGATFGLWFAACAGHAPPGADAAALGGDAAVNTQALCDGSSELRLAVRLLPGGAPPDLQRLVIYDHGAEYLFLSGTCEYWVWRPPPEGVRQNQWFPTKHGLLGNEESRKLAKDLGYAAWDDLRGTWNGQDVFDGSPVVLHDRSRSIVCQGSCIPMGADATQRAAGMLVREITRKGGEWIATLYAAGSDVSGPVRLNVFPAANSYPGLLLVPWPLSSPIELFVNKTPPERLKNGISSLVTVPADTQALRKLRQDRIDGRLGDYTVIGIERPGSDTPYLLFLRDSVPWENGSGLIEIPSAPPR